MQRSCVASLALLLVGCGGHYQSQDEAPAFRLLATSDANPSALAVSDDGRIVAGSTRSDSLNSDAVVWTDGAEMAVAAPAGTTALVVRGVDAGGRVFVGTATPPLNSTNTIISPFRATKEGGDQILSFSEEYYTGFANAVDASGSVVVGTLNMIRGGSVAFRWTNGSSVVLSSLIGADNSSADGVSSDGNVAVGFSGASAVRWVGTSAPQALTAEGSEGRALDASADGSAIVGYAAAALGGTRLAFRWTASEGFASLGTLPGFTQSSAVAVSNDGKVVIGNATNGPRPSSEPFVWTPTGGLRALRDVLTGDRYAPFRALPNVSVNDVSRDGKTIVGTSYDETNARYQAFSLRLP